MPLHSFLYSNYTKQNIFYSKTNFATTKMRTPVGSERAAFTDAKVLTILYKKIPLWYKILLPRH